MVDSRPFRVLFVDDDRLTLYSLERLARSRGWEVCTARNTEEALSCIDQFTPDVAVLDMRLPSIGGTALGREIRRHPRTAHTELVAYTALEGEGVWMGAREESFSTRVLKPDTGDRLFSLLESRAVSATSIH